MAKKRIDEGGVATLEPPVGLAGDQFQEADAAPPIVKPIVEQPPLRQAPISPGIIGWPVQFTNNDGSIVPGRLQRRSASDVNLWDVKVSISGASMDVTRSGVKFSPAPKPGCWNFMPGLVPQA